MADLAWRFILQDGMSAPARRMTASLRAVDAALRGTTATEARAARQSASAARVVEGSIQRLRRAYSVQVGGRSAGFGFRQWGAGAAEAATRTEGAGSALAGLGGQLGVLVAVAAGWGLVGTAIGGVALAAGRGVVQMAAFRESTLTALGTVLGGGARGAAAQGAFRWAGQVARQTPLDERQVIEVMRQASVGGFRDSMLRAVTAAATDIGAANPQDSTAASRFIVAISQLRGSSAVRAQELNQLREVGIGREAMLRALAQVGGVSRGGTETETAFLQRVQGMQERGRFTGAQGAQAALAAVSATLGGGGPLGTFARAQGGTLTGVLSNVEAAVFSLVTSINDLENIPGVRAFKSAMDAVMQTIGVGTKGGTAIQGIIVRLVNAGGGLFRLFDAKRLSGALGRALVLFEGMAAVARTLAPIIGAVVRGFGEGFGTALRPMLAAVGALGGAQGSVTALAVALGALGRFLGFVAGVAVTGSAVFVALNTAVTGSVALIFGAVQVLVQLALVAVGAATGVGGAIIDGLVAGIRGGETRVREAIGGVVHGAINSAKGLLGIASPSRVFTEIGGQTAAGFALGVEGGAPAARSSLAALVAPPGLGGLRAGGGASVTVNVNVGAGTPDETRDAARDGTLQALAQVFDTLALAGGT